MLETFNVLRIDEPDFGCEGLSLIHIYAVFCSDGKSSDKQYSKYAPEKENLPE